MNCPAVITGDEFLLRLIGSIDCRSRELGSFGYAALGQPGSTASLVMSGLLTILVALFGYRLLFGPGPGARDGLMAVLRVGIVLTLAFSWPAWKVLVHDVVLDGPAEIAGQIVPPTLAPPGTDLPGRLQAADASMVTLTTLNSGRATGAILADRSLGGSFSGVALKDEESLGNGRLFFLAGVIASFALLRIAAGLMLALAPLAAGMLLFDMTRGLFSGWLRALVWSLVGSVGASLVLLLELSLLEPWLADALRLRRLGYATPAAPTELYAMTFAFAAVLVGMVWLVGRVVFTRGWQDWQAARGEAEPRESVPAGMQAGPSAAAAPAAAGRAAQIVDSVETQLRREQGSYGQRTISPRSSGEAGSPSDPTGTTPQSTARPLGSGYRRTARRSTLAGKSRDRMTR